MTSATLQSNRILRLFGRALAVLLLGLALAGLVAFFLLDTLALLIARPILAPYGLVLQQIQGLQVDRHRILLQRVDFQLNGASESSQIEQLELLFSDSGLLAMPLQRLHAQHVKITLADTAQSGTRDTPAAFPDLPRLDAMLEVLQAIPTDAVEFSRLDIAPYINAGRLNVTRIDQELRMQIEAQETQLAFSANWHDTSSSQSAPTQTLPSAGQSPKLITGELQVAALGAQLLSTHFTLSELDSLLQIDASSELQLQPISDFAQHAGLLPAAVTALDGVLSANWHLTETTPEDAEQRLSFSISINPDSRILALLNPTLTADLHQGVWQNPEAVDAGGSYAFGTGDWDLHLVAPTTTLSLSIGQADPAQLTFAVDSVDIHCDADFACLLTQATRLQFSELTWVDTRLQDLLLISNGSVAVEEGRYTVQFAQGSRLELGAVQSPSGQLTQVNVLVQQALDLALDTGWSMQLSSQGIDLYLPNILINGKNSHVVSALSQLSAHYSDSDMQLQAHAQLRNLGSEWLPFTLRKPELEIDIDSRNSSVALKGQLRVADRDLLHFDSTLDLETRAGELHVETPVLDFASGSQSLSQWFFQAPFTADLIAGSLQGSADLTIGTDSDARWLLNGPIRLDLNELSGFFQETGFIRLSTQLGGQLQDSTDFKTDTTRPFKLASIDLGLAIEDMQFLYDIDTRATLISVEDFNARLFRGRAHSEGLRFDWSAPSNHVTLELERIDLSSMLSMAAYDSIQATGLISGTLPISLTGTSPSIGAGSLQVEPPGGAIRYSPDGGASSGNATLDFVNQALSNYQYDLMETTVEYLPTGELQLGVRLQGLNPDMNSGQRINLNLNISDNIPALLRSLQSGRSIADSLERELQAR